MELGDEVYYIKEGTFRVDEVCCPKCGGKGSARGLKAGYPLLQSVCHHCHGIGTIPHDVKGYRVMGPNTIVNMAHDNIVVSSQRMWDEIVLYKNKKGVDFQRAFTRYAGKYSWETIGKNDVVESPQAAYEYIETVGGILIN